MFWVSSPELAKFRLDYSFLQVQHRESTDSPEYLGLIPKAPAAASKAKWVTADDEQLKGEAGAGEARDHITHILTAPKHQVQTYTNTNYTQSLALQSDTRQVNIWQFEITGCETEKYLNQMQQSPSNFIDNEGRKSTI